MNAQTPYTRTANTSPAYGIFIPQAQLSARIQKPNEMDNYARQLQALHAAHTASAAHEAYRVLRHPTNQKHTHFAQICEGNNINQSANYSLKNQIDEER